MITLDKQQIYLSLLKLNSSKTRQYSNFVCISASDSVSRKWGTSSSCIAVFNPACLTYWCGIPRWKGTEWIPRTLYPGIPSTRKEVHSFSFYREFLFPLLSFFPLSYISPSLPLTYAAVNPLLSHHFPLSSPLLSSPLLSSFLSSSLFPFILSFPSLLLSSFLLSS